METRICRTCGCSLVRLGISDDEAAARHCDGEQHLFCCEGCADLFVTDPEQYLRETQDLIVCPTCLAEKPMGSAVTVSIGGKEVHFCRCPYCVEVFKQDPDFYAQRLQGAIPNEGVLDHEGCCVKPPSPEPSTEQHRV